MAKVERVEFIDDLDGKPIDADDLNRVEFEVKLPGRQPVRYGMDLRTASVARFERDMGKYIAKADKMPRNGRATRPVRSSVDTTPSPAPAAPEQKRTIREWAIDNGYEISDRGRVPARIVEAYEAAH
ncbi:histone-like nucleoid-structuring protein Lsr2 [Gordonia hankookensis]|uniref:Lsr2 family protein n=1 Tax=Gordonia hankookensis TaxID=589403 RepID=A0ABR7WCU8_9ACTN|nr:Lsr2 family protein [Gordonia hankookensis]MBD1320188.1 Lsr2 family protein [Gordonia hankookensis]